MSVLLLNLEAVGSLWAVDCQGLCRSAAVQCVANDEKSVGHHSGCGSGRACAMDSYG